MAGIVSASTRRPASAWAAARGAVWSSSSPTSNPIVLSSSASCAADRIVLLVTKRRRWPSVRSRATASARARDRLARQMEAPVDVEQNGRHPREFIPLKVLRTFSGR